MNWEKKDSLKSTSESSRHALLRHRLGPEIARDWLDKQCWPVERITMADENRATMNTGQEIGSSG